MKARIVRYGFIGVVAVLIILCGMKFSNMYKDYQKLQFNQEQIDTQVSVLMSMLFSDLYYSDPIDLGETKEHADELSVLLQVTSYDEIPHFNDIANKLIEISKNVESRPAFSEQRMRIALIIQRLLLGAKNWRYINDFFNCLCGGIYNLGCYLNM